MEFHPLTQLFRHCRILLPMLYIPKLFPNLVAQITLSTFYCTNYTYKSRRLSLKLATTNLLCAAVINSAIKADITPSKHIIDSREVSFAGVHATRCEILQYLWLKILKSIVVDISYKGRLYTFRDIPLVGQHIYHVIAYVSNILLRKCKKTH